MVPYPIRRYSATRLIATTLFLAQTGLFPSHASAQILNQKVDAMRLTQPSSLDLNREDWTACLSVQGNGSNFPTLIGSAVALLERGVIPVVTMGGSSASLVAPTIQAVLHNTSIRAARVLTESGRELTLSEKAAVVLSASSVVSESILFLPNLADLPRTVRNILLYQAAVDNADAFVGTPDQELALLEAIAGQGVLVADFFATADFSSILAGSEPAARAEAMRELWMKQADLLAVTPQDFIRALLPLNAEQRDSELSRSLRMRFFGLFRRDTSGAKSDPDVALQAYEQFLLGVETQLGKLPPEQLESAFLAALDTLRGAPFVGSIASTLSKPFLLPSPSKVWSAYNGISLAKGKSIRMPPGTILHTTGRIATTGANGQPIELLGLKNFRQVYFPADDVAADLELQRDALNPGRSFIEAFSESQGWESPLPREQLIVLSSRPLAQAVKLSIAEPNAFRRDDIPLDSGVLAQDTALASAGRLVTFGGWLEHLPMTTLSKISACQNVDLKVTIANPTKGLKDFQRRAIRAVIDGPAAFQQTVAERSDPTSPVNRFMDSLWRVFDYALTLEGQLGRVKLDFNWDEPIPGNDPARAEVESAITQSTRSLFLAAYQDSFETLQGMELFANRPGVLATDLATPRLTHASTPKEVSDITSRLLPGK
ncbi:MAG: hypothetical protein M3Q07_23470 [Pseudobdellovibrionaceae bacterium]|nr:hypothetical protein [Pseudobdellovibrionaceae bacterium]